MPGAQLPAYGVLRYLLKDIDSRDQLLVQLLSACYQCGRSGNQFPGPVKLTQCRQWLATVATFLRSCVAQALSRNSLHAAV